MKDDPGEERAVTLLWEIRDDLRRVAAALEEFNRLYRGKGV